MTLNEVKTWVNNLPSEYGEYNVFNGEYGTIDNEHYYRVDKPITTIAVDTETEEILFLNDTDSNINQSDDHIKIENQKMAEDMNRQLTNEK